MLGVRDDGRRVVVRCFLGSAWGGELGPCGGRGVGLREEGGTSSFGNFWLLATSPHAFAFGGLVFLLFNHDVGCGHPRYAMSDGKINSIGVVV